MLLEVMCSKIEATCKSRKNLMLSFFIIKNVLWKGRPAFWWYMITGSDSMSRWLILDGRGASLAIRTRFWFMLRIWIELVWCFGKKCWQKFWGFVAFLILFCYFCLYLSIDERIKYYFFDYIELQKENQYFDKKYTIFY